MLPDNSGTRINGVSLTAMGLVQTGPISVGEAKAATSLVDVPGMDGSLDLTLEDATGSAFIGRRIVTVPLAAVGTILGVGDAKAAIGAYNGREVYLYDQSLDGEWHGRLTLSAWTGAAESWTGQAYAAVTATIEAEPALLKSPTTLELSSGTNSVFVEGNRHSWPTFDLVPTRQALAIGVTVNDGNGNSTGTARYMSESIITDEVYVNCFMGYATSDGSILETSLYHDFPVLVPGNATVTLIGCSSATMTYRPRVMV